jgi:ABC-type antimicrobial peptide transport system permease subunit
MALGARPADVQWMVLREGLWLTAAGIGLGLVLAVAVGQVLGFLLFQVSPLDPVVFVAAPLVLALAATLACYVPARRATRVAPLTALRTE